MKKPLVSVIIPAYRGADLIAEAIQSVLNQTYPHFELIVVDDASPDDTAAIVARFTDSRIRLIVHEDNRGGHGARRTGFDASSGEIIAFLDQDDMFHPEKLAAHVDFLAHHPEVGLTYNPHFTLLHPSRWLFGISRPPAHVTLADLVLGFPIAPSVWVLRREWAAHEEVWDRSAMLRGAEAVICGRLLMRGCRFARIDRVLNYRRIHQGRRFSDPATKCHEERLCQQVVLNDPRCPAEVEGIRVRAAVENYFVWANVALAQHDSAAGVALLREALHLEPTSAVGRPSRLVQFIINHAIESSADFEARIDVILRQLPSELAHVAMERDWIASQAHLLTGARHCAWDRPEHAARHFARATALGGHAGPFFYDTVSHELIGHALTFGRKATRKIVAALDSALNHVDGHDGRALRGRYHLGLAFARFRAGEHRSVPTQVVRAFIEQPDLLANRGAWSILLRSATRYRDHDPYGLPQQ